MGAKATDKSKEDIERGKLRQLLDSMPSISNEELKQLLEEVKSEQIKAANPQSSQR